jgi:hypothetical protein
MKIKNIKDTIKEITNLFDFIAFKTTKGTIADIMTYIDHSSSKKTNVKIPKTNEKIFRPILE